MLALPAKIHIFRPHSLALLRSFGKLARQVLDVTLAKCDFAALYHTLFNVPTAPLIQCAHSTAYSMCPQHRNVCDAPLCGSMSKHFTRSFVAQRFKSAFHVFALAKTFHFCAEDMLAYCSLLSAQKFHVLRKGAQLRLMLIAPMRRTSGCSVTLPGHMSIRVHRRTRDLRTDLDKGAAGNTCRIIAFYFVHLSHIYSLHICRAGAIKGAWESDGFACRFGRQRRR